MATARAGGSEDFSDFSYSRTRPESEAARDEVRRGTAVRVVASQALDAADARHLLSVLGLSLTDADSVGDPSRRHSLVSAESS